MGLEHGGGELPPGAEVPVPLEQAIRAVCDGRTQCAAHHHRAAQLGESKKNMCALKGA